MREVSGALRDVLCRHHGYRVAAWARQAVESIGVQVWGGGAGTERQFQRLPRISSFLLLLSLVITPPLPPSVPSSVGRASASQVCFHFSGGNAPQRAVQTLRGPSLRNQSKLWGRVILLLRNPKTCLHVRSNNDGCINTHLHFRAFSKMPSSRTHLVRRRLHKRWFGLIRRAVRWTEGEQSPQRLRPQLRRRR